MATEALIAHVLISKFADHLPLYRQAQIFLRQGIALDRSTLSDWVGRACWWLTPLYERLSAVLAADKISPMIRRCRCSIPAADGPRTGGSGAMRSTIDHGAAKPAGGRLCVF